jgi:alanine racemase
MPAAVAVVDASALRHNLRTVRDAAPGCRVLAVVKANAYGHGLVPVARILAGADGLAVARLEEAAQLRDAGITGRVVVLGGFVGPEEARYAAARALDVVVHSDAQLEALEGLGAPLAADAWLKVDTGMGRLGLAPDAVPAAITRLRACLAPGRALRLMTHLASADEASSAATPAQLAAFGALLGAWRGDVSIANSAGLLLWPGTRQPAPAAGGANWVRPGLMLYGVSPVPDRRASNLGLRPVMSFETRLIAVRRLPAGSRVGYGGDWRATRESIVGVAAAGYADGYPWHLSRGTPVTVAGRRAPVIGRVSMDMISIDLTDVPGAAPGDRVVLWGEDPPVEEVARCAGTIPYELLAAMSPRVERRVADREDGEMAASR